MTGRCRSIRWWRWHPVRCAHPAGHKTARGNNGVGAWLRTLRKQAGLSQTEVARRMGCERSWICHLERGSYDPRLSTIMRYGNAIGAHIHIGLNPANDRTKP